MKQVAGVVFLFLTAFALRSFGGGSAARDLGEGLVYLRMTAELDSAAGALALRDNELGQAALVLDLRYLQEGTADAKRLCEWLSGRVNAPSETLPVFFLVNAETSTALREAAAQFAQNYPALLIGPADDGGGFLPDIALAIDPEAERAAYTVLASGEADIAALIGEDAGTDKRRYDEAAVIAAHAAPESGREPSEARPRRRRSDSASDSESTEGAGNAALVRPVDLALQRAIHLHRAWRVFEQHPQP